MQNFVQAVEIKFLPLKNMFCPNCGKKITDDSKFCENCGKKIEFHSKNSIFPVSQDLFYSKDWVKSGLYISSIPHFDILFTPEYFYLIELPNSHAATIGIIIGFFLGSLIGALIGQYIGSSIDNNKRKEFRSRWINNSGALISTEYENHYMLKIPLYTFKDNFYIEGKKITISHNNKKIVLTNKTEEIKRLSEFLHNINLI
jgi:hypothetical protein